MSNLKVHFAGAENLPLSHLMKHSDINYCLGSVYSFIQKQYLKDNKEYDTKTIEYWNENFTGTILDSGIFTLIYGAGKRDNWDPDTWIKWQDTLVDFIKTSGFKGYPVEVDAQKIIGVEETWKLRTKLRDDLPDHQVINVWHVQDGQMGLDRMIEFSDYIAFSVQELRKIKSINHKDYSVKLANYIKNKKPNIKIHLLACTETSLLRDLNFCTSSDSTAWLQINKFGQGKIIQDGKPTMAKKDEILDTLPLYYEKAREIHKSIYGQDAEPSDKNLIWQSSYLLSLQELKKIYSLYAGPQN